MRMCDFAKKEIVNIYNGARLGVGLDSDMLVDVNTGEIQSIIMPGKTSFFNLWMDRQEVIIPWEAIKKIGSEVIIIELDPTSSYCRRFPV